MYYFWAIGWDVACCWHAYNLLIWNFTGAEISDEDNSFIHEESGHVDEGNVIIEQVINEEDKINFEKDKEDTKQIFLKCLSGVDSPSKLDIIKKAMDSILPLLAAANEESTSSFSKSEENIVSTAKRRLVCTKKH